VGTLIALALLALAPSTAVAAAPTLAVTYFDNNTAEERFDPLGRGLADMLITDLAGLEGLTVVERGRLNDILSELELQASTFVDPSTAVQVGKGLGARYVLTGAFLAVEPDMRIDARIVDVSTGEVVEADAVQGPVAEFFLLEKELAAQIVDRLEVRMSARESARMGRPATESFEAFVAWSAGLEALDRGALEEARDELATALEHDDRFALAESELERLQERLRQLSTREQEARSSYARDLLRRLDELEAAGGPWDRLSMDLLDAQVQLSGIGTSYDALKVTSRLMDLGLPEELMLGGQYGVTAVNEWALCRFAEASYYVGERAQLLTYGEACLERYPASHLAGEPRRLMGLTLDLIQKERAAMLRLPSLEAEARAYGLFQVCAVERDPATRHDACRGRVEGMEKHGLAWEDDGARDDALEAWGLAAARDGDRGSLEAAIAAARAWKGHTPAVRELEEALGELDQAARDAEAKLATVRSSKKDGEWYRAAWALSDAGRHAEAKQLIEEALQRFPTSGKLYRYEASTAIDLGDLPRVEEALRRWEAAGLEVEPDILGKLDEARPLFELAVKAGGWEPFHLANITRDAGLHGPSAEASLRLYREHPEFDLVDRAQPLYYAAFDSAQAMDPARARALFEELIESHPDSTWAPVARANLETLP